MATPDINTMAVNPARANQRHNYVITDFFLGYDEAGVVPGQKQDVFGKDVGDVEMETAVKQPGFFSKIIIQTTDGINKFFQDWFGIQNAHHFFFLALLGIFTSLIAFLTDLITVWAIHYKLEWVRDPSLPYYVRYLIYIGCALVFTLIAASMSPLVSREVEGSGLPEIKAIIAGVNIHKYLALRTGIAKQIGVSAAIIAGLPVGREGPFIHLSACIAQRLSKWSWFSDIGNNQALKKTMYSAAVAAGMTCTFGAPLGAVLFSIEVSTTYYMVSNLFKGFFCAIFALIIFKVTDYISWLHLFFTTHFPTNIEVDHELLLFALLGVLCGVFGAVFVQVMTKITFMRHKLKVPFVSDRWKWCIGVALITGLMKFPTDFMIITDYQILNHMFASTDLDSYQHGVWNTPNTAFNLLVCVILKFILIILAVCSPIPSSLLSPAFILGAVFGRLYGYCMRTIGIWCGFPLLVKYEGIYAIVGAASLAGAVTRTVSIAMMVFEICGQTNHMIPILVGVLLSYAVASSMALSAFDALIDIKNLPFLPSLTGYSTYHLNAKDLMNENFLYLTQNSRLSDLAVIISKVGMFPYTVPIVETESRKTLLFTIQSQQLRKYLVRRYHQVSSKLDQEVKFLLNQFIYNLNCLSLGEDLKNKDFCIDPFIASKEYQVNQLISVHQSQYPRDDVSNPLIGDDYEQTNLMSKVYRQQQALEQFWSLPIDFEDQQFQKDNAPFIVMEDTPMSKLHFLFIMLNISQVNIINEGVITGIISKIEFLKKRKQEEKLIKKERRRRRFQNYFGLLKQKPSTRKGKDTRRSNSGLLDNISMNRHSASHIGEGDNTPREHTKK